MRSRAKRESRSPHEQSDTREQRTRISPRSIQATAPACHKLNRHPRATAKRLSLEVRALRRVCVARRSLEGWRWCLWPQCMADLQAHPSVL